MTAKLKDVFVGAGLALGMVGFSLGMIETSFLSQHIASGVWFRDLLIAAAAAFGVAVASRYLFDAHFWRAMAFVYGAFVLVTFGPTAVGAVAVLWLVSLAIGAAILRGPDNRLVALQCVTGLAVLLLAFGVSVQFPVNTRFTYLLGAVVILAVLHKSLAASLANLVDGARRPSRPPSFGEVLLAGAVLFVFAWHALGAALPERFWDPLVVHLYAPAYIKAFGVWDLPPDAGVFAAMPMAVDLGFSAAFLFGGEAAAHLIDLTFFLVLVCLLFQVLSLHVSAQAAGWLTLVFATTPIAFFETRALMIEHGLMLFLFAAFAAVITAGDNVRGSFAAACLCLAAAIASKLQGVVAAAAIGMMLIPHLGFRYGLREVVGRVSVAVACVAVGVVPYLAAYLRTDNPLFPFYNSHFKSPFFPEVDFADPRWPPYLSWDSIYQFTFNSTRFGEHQVGAFGFQFILLLAAGALATAVFPRRYLVFSLLVGVFYASVLLMNTAYIRYLYVVFPFFILAVASIWLASRWVKLIASALLCVSIIGNILFLTTAAGVLADVSLDNVFEPEEQDRLIETFVGERKLIDRLNASDFPAPRVLMMGALPGALAGVAYQTNWYSWFLNETLRGARTKEEVLGVLREKGITHVLLGTDAKSLPVVVETVLASGEIIDKEASVLLLELDIGIWAETIELVETSEVSPVRNAIRSFNVGEGAASQPRLYRIVASVDCGVVLDVVYVQINWAGPDGGISAESKPLVCQSTGQQELSADMVGPAGLSSGAVFEIVREDGGQSVFRNIQLWRGQPVPTPWVW